MLQRYKAAFDVCCYMEKHYFFLVARAAGKMPPSENGDDEEIGLLKPLVSVSAGTVPHPDRLAWASIILENSEVFPTASRWHDVREKIIKPQLKDAMRDSLNLKGEEEDILALKAWVVRYRQVLDEVFNAVTDNLEHAGHHRSNRVADFLDTHCKPLRRFETLQQKAIAVSISILQHFVSRF